MTRKELTRVFGAFDTMNVLIIGDVMIDSYLWGDVSRISPEAPVPIIATTGRENRLGGAANVALNIQALGATPIMCSVIAKDEAGSIFMDLLKENKLPAQGIITTGKRQTTVKTRIISQQQHLLRIDEEANTPLDESLEGKLQAHIEDLLNTYRIDAIIFEDYDKGVLTPATIEYTVKLAQSKGIPTLVDPKKRNFLAYNEVTFFKPNLKEFKEGAKVEINGNDREGLLKAAKDFAKQQGIRHFMLTMAEKGVLILNEQQHHFIPAQVRKIADVSGAGDTVISVSALCLAGGLDQKHVAGIANMAGGLVCEYSGVVPIDKQALLDECFEKLTNE
ncbi:MULTISPECIES: bifunctional heptose 7-phosphate kinase/heptose 1-phosphate adenyltransferase [unclassified Carboxylicivirga]|uniref:bifunctional heptose 7-phosphate kinase/heptose 1-phosphate adenyltransferase n=1 Tax=Carboxylicivirga TaxID=1628153 RepID=UPI003D339DC6